MVRWHKAAGLLVLGLLLLPAPARADRIRSGKVTNQPSSGARNDITVPYGTNGRSTLGVYQGVAPRIYSSPVADNPSEPQAKPVFNLPFYGAVQGFGGQSNGAVPRPPGPPLGGPRIR